jgi:hypothetical protein
MSRLFLCCLAVGLAAVAARADDVVVANAEIEIRWHEDNGHVSIAARPSGRVVLRDVTFGEDRGQARAIKVADEVLGPGDAIEITHGDGSAEIAAVYPNSPFAFIRARRANPGDEPAVLNHVPSLSGAVVLGKPASAVKTFGTGGLLAADKNPGSYAWLAVVDPPTRQGVVFGWLTHDRGSGVLFSKVEGDAVRVDARLDYGRLLIDPSAATDLETLAVGYFDDARLGLEQWATAVARHYQVNLPPQPTGYCTWYSKPHGGASDERRLAELAEFCARQLAPFGFSVVQIDDKWQAGESTNGPRREFLRHDPNGPYPSGMQAIANRVASMGLTPGLWYMPFAGTHYDPFFKDKQGWFVKRTNGEPYETAWGGTCLDLTNPDVQDYVRTVADQVVNAWGFRYLKLDGLWTGTATKQQYVNAGFKDDGIGDAVFHDPHVTNVQAYRSGLQLVRDTVGRQTFILGCNGPQNMRSYGGAFGLVDAMRVGPDNGAEWNRLTRGPEFGSRHYFLHGRVWYNDPDPVYVRDSMPLEHARLICSWVAVSGQLNLSSEWIPGLPKDRLDILKRTMPSHGLKPRPVDVFEHDPPRIWLLTDDRGAVRRDVVGVFNWDDRELVVDESLEHIGLNPAATYDAFDYWANERLPAIAGSLKITVPPQSCRILAVRPRAGHPQLLSTSRHVTQGIVDVAAESWDAATRTLRGTSRLVAGDRYELRIVLPEGGDWKVASFEAAGESASASQEGGLVRASVQPQTGRDVQWALRFQP